MRNPQYTLLKALAILLVVLAHSCAPSFLGRFAYLTGVPAFFVLAGYFFNPAYLDDKTTFVVRRVRSLYLPFVKWSLFFLLLHNLLFPLGLLSEQYGNAAGGVTHPYSWSQGMQQLWSIVFNMSGYDTFLAGAFWFFRTLFVASLAFLAAFWVARRVKWLNHPLLQVGSVSLLALLLALWQSLSGTSITGLAQGGYRELMALCFMGIGFMLHYAEDRCGLAALAHPMLNLAAGLPLALLTVFYPVSMTPAPSSPGAVAALVLGGSSAFLFLRGVAHFLLLLPWEKVRSILLFVGENTIYVFGFHLLAFKLVSALKVGVYALPWEMVGGHPVVVAYKDDAFWVLYTLVGLTVPLLWVWGWRTLCTTYHLNPASPRDWLRLIIQLSILFFRGVRWLIFKTWAMLVAFSLGVWDTCRSIIDASSPGDDDDEEYDDEEEEEEQEQPSKQQEA